MCVRFLGQEGTSLHMLQITNAIMPREFDDSLLHLCYSTAWAPLIARVNDKIWNHHWTMLFICWYFVLLMSIVDQSTFVVMIWFVYNRPSFLSGNVFLFLLYSCYRFIPPLLAIEPNTIEDTVPLKLSFILMYCCISDLCRIGNPCTEVVTLTEAWQL